ncbi:MAG: hypothetical protein JOZ87_23520 [Chloroflexi bacterium]|nr:hypothetical protein [Chloroflexota bacterium]
MTPSTSDQALSRLAGLEAMHRELSTLYALEATVEPAQLVTRARAERESLDRLLTAVDQVRDERLSALATEMRQSTGRGVAGEMRGPELKRPGRESMAAAGFQFEGGH